MYSLLIVEDDPIIRQEVASFFAAWGYEVKAVLDFARVMEDFAAFDPQLVLLDLKLPVLGGYHWCREIRKVSTVPIMFITSAADNLTAVTAMNLGADDLIAKPFDLAVLAAKVEALMRRAYGYAPAQNTFEAKGMLYKPGEASAAFDGQQVELTRNENRILSTLMEHRGQVVSRELLITRLWETDAFIDESALSVNVGRLRRKLEQIGVLDLIKTHKGEGYRVE